MGYSGQYKRSFTEANMAVVVDISCNADYPHFSFELVSVQAGKVTIRNRGEEFTLPIKTKRRPGNKRLDIEPYHQQYVVIEQSALMNGSFAVASRASLRFIRSVVNATRSEQRNDASQNLSCTASGYLSVVRPATLFAFRCSF